MFESRRLAAESVLSGVLAVFVLLAAGASIEATQSDRPARLTDQEFWSLSEALSEPSGQFATDNLVSNETGYQLVIPELVSRVSAGGVYLGVGPEQNFTYIAALKPRIAFILDIRRGNRDLHLLYKALFELAADRSEFVSLLFSRPKPANLPKDATPVDLFAAFGAVAPAGADYERNLARIKNHLVATRRLPLSIEELKGIEYVYSNFFRFGPWIGYSSSRNSRVTGPPNYASLMQATDATGMMRGFLATETNFEVVRRLQSANLIVPVVANFSGPKSLRAVATWLRDRNASVSAYYLSNVEDYLSLSSTWLDFCGNAATLPLAEQSSFIRSGGGYRPSPGAVQQSGTPPLSAIPTDQLTALVSKGGGTITLPDGRVVTIVTSFPVGQHVTPYRTGVNTSRLGLIADDLAPCVPPKIGGSWLFNPDDVR